MSNNNTSSGVGIGGLLLVAFVILKLCKVIDWDWLWVLAPAWMPLALLASILLVVLALAGLVKCLGK